MSGSIGLRAYRISVKERGEKNRLPLDSNSLNTTLPNFMDDFISSHNSPTQNDKMERSWYFEEKKRGEKESKGYIHYGTFGFESNFVDNKTKKKNYRRLTTDVEVIPLYYEIWIPEGEFFGLCIFQSFQGRSCISMVMSAVKEDFEKKNPQHLFMYNKLQPGDMSGSAYFSAPVKKLRLIKKKASADITDKYFNTVPSEAVDFEVVLSAQRRRSLGPLEIIQRSFKSADGGVIAHDGMEFEEAVAEISVGGRKRQVGVLGFNGDAGVIDVSDVITRGADGHPTFESLETEADAILSDFYGTLHGSTS